MRERLDRRRWERLERITKWDDYGRDLDGLYIGHLATEVDILATTPVAATWKDQDIWPRQSPEWDAVQKIPRGPEALPSWGPYKIKTAQERRTRHEGPNFVTPPYWDIEDDDTNLPTETRAGNEHIRQTPASVSIASTGGTQSLQATSVNTREVQPFASTLRCLESKNTCRMVPDGR